MAIVVYKCDVCKRDIELEQNINSWTETNCKLFFTMYPQ